MAPIVDRLAIVGQGLIGSSITRAVIKRGVAREVIVTDASAKVRKRVAELGFGTAKVASSNIEAIDGADLVVACIPVGQYGPFAREIRKHLKRDAIISDVGSVKGSVVKAMTPHLPKNVHLVPAHPLAGTEQSGPDSGVASLFENRWCVLTPPKKTSPAAIAKVKAFWEAIGSEVEIMSVRDHDRVLAITSHLPHLIAFAIFHTGLKEEEALPAGVMKYSAGGFRDFTRIASSNPTMWRDIFLNNKDAVLDVLKQFKSDLNKLAKAIERGNADKLFDALSKSRLTRRKVIEKEHISVVKPPKEDSRLSLSLYGSDD
jgi:cyclohexadieny/prephenate dehydrogenase